jgi:hypothetical protein
VIFRKDKHRGEKLKDDRGDVVIVLVPFVTSEGAAQKARPTSLDHIMTLPRRLVARRLGHLADETMMKRDKKI